VGAPEGHALSASRSTAPQAPSSRRLSALQVVRWCELSASKRREPPEDLSELPPPPPPPAPPPDPSVPDRDAAFVRSLPDRRTLFDVLVAADYLDIEPLVDLLARRVAGLVRGRGVAELRRDFGIRSDWSREEEALLQGRGGVGG